MSGIVIRGLTKTYDKSIKAIDCLDLEVREGELLAVVGPSGSGKTTLLRLVAGLEQPTAGEILLAGQNLADVPPRGRDVALVFQSLALYEHWTVRQNLAFAARQNIGSGELIDEVSRWLRIEHLLDRLPAELSGGEQQRVALGRAIVRRPQALLLDEPLSSLDLPLRRALRGEVRSVQRRLGVPTIYVTHDQAEALAVGDRIAVLNEGRLAQVGTPDEIYDRPQTRFVAEFFGPQGMNLIQGEITEEGFAIKLPDGSYYTALNLPVSCFPDNALIDGPVLLGIRPEDIDVLVIKTDQESTARGAIQSVEYLGESQYLNVKLDGTAIATEDTPQVTVRVAKNYIRPTDSLIRLVFRNDRLHFFDLHAGKRLTTDNLPAPAAYDNPDPRLPSKRARP